VLLRSWQHWDQLLLGKQFLTLAQPSGAKLLGLQISFCATVSEFVVCAALLVQQLSKMTTTFVALSWQGHPPLAESVTVGCLHCAHQDQRASE